MTAPRRALDFAEPRIVAERAADGSVTLRPEAPLEPCADNLGALLLAGAVEHLDRVMFAERDGAGWRTATYGQALRAAQGLAEALLGRGLGPDRPVMILSGNSLNHALLMLGGLLAGVPLAPVSPAYSLMSADFGKLRHIAALVRPGLVYVEVETPFESALSALDLRDVDVMTAEELMAIAATPPGPALGGVEVGPDSVAKYLFTSGSTGLPKGVINTHGMLTANQQMAVQVWPFLKQTPPVLVDWLPWNHTFGGNHNFNLVLARGGTMYIDQGKPAPGLVEETVRNLAEISPTVYFNVPAGYAQLVPYLERDKALRDRFFARLQMIFYAAAALPQDLWERLERLSVAATGERVVMSSAWGLTETAPLATSAHFPIDRAGVIGVPVPGVELKLVPADDKLEIRVRGPNVTPGYLGDSALTARAFDEDGFFRTGDAVRFADPDDPNAGLLFDGRVAENFKLMTGTWVDVGWLRVGLVAACSPVVQDAVIAGEDGDRVGALIWPNVAACRGLAGLGDDAGMAEVAAAPEVKAKLKAGLEAWNDRHRASSTRIARALFLTTPADIDKNEITDKGYINQRAALRARADEVARLFAEAPDDDVLVL